MMLSLALLAVGSLSKVHGRATRSMYELWDNKRWGKSEVLYALDGTLLPKTLTKAEAHTALSKAFKTWSSVIPLDFKEVSLDEKHDMRLSFIMKHHGFAERHGDVADCEFHPGVVAPATIHFDAAEVWLTDVSKDSNDGYDFETEALHEIGHCIGLDHSKDSKSVMSEDAYPGIYKRKLTKDDIEGAQAIYGQRLGPPPPPASAPGYYAPPAPAPPAPPFQLASHADGSSSMNTVMIVLGVFVLLGLVVALVWWWRRSRRNKNLKPCTIENDAV